MKSTIILYRYLLLFIFLSFLVFSTSSHSSAHEILNPYEVGRNDCYIGGYSVTGVRILYNGADIALLGDTWYLSGPDEVAGSEYVGTCYLEKNTNIYYTGYYYEGYDDGEYPIAVNDMTGSRVSKHRYFVYPGRFESYFMKHSFGYKMRRYTTVLNTYYKGKDFNRKVETPYEDPFNSELGIYSFRAMEARGDDHIEIGYPYGNEISTIYNLIPVRYIGEGCEYSIGSDYSSIVSTGEVYYDGKCYRLHSLPEVTKQKEGYMVSFDGWYDQPYGGNRIQLESVVPDGMVFYPRWKEIPNDYSVKCIDILGQDPSGTILGENTWMQSYETTAYGSQAGSLKTTGLYYKGLSYCNCSSTSVALAGTTVYRYFEYGECPVELKDVVVFSNHERKELGSSKVYRTYTSWVQAGDELGKDTSSGAYYQGYCYSSDSGGEVDESGTVVYRYFKPIQYTVHFDGNDANYGNMTDETKYDYGIEYSLPSNRYKKYITLHLDLNASDASCTTDSIMLQQDFLGWSEQKDGSISYQDTGKFSNLLTQSGEKTLFACWEDVDWHSSIVPTRMGYQFSGWARESNAINGKSDFILSQEETLYAIWKPDVVPYYVEYYKENLEGSYERIAQYDFKNYTGSQISIQDSLPEYGGYDIDLSLSHLTGTVKGDGSLIVSAYYKRKNYSYHFSYEEGSIQDQETLKDLVGKYEENKCIPETVPTRYGYQFIGWGYDKAQKNQLLLPGDIIQITNHDQTLYAKWKPKQTTINLVPNTPDGEVYPSQSISLTYAEPVTLSACALDVRGYEFVDWNTKEDGSGTTYQTEDVLCEFYQDEPLTLYARWKPKQGEIQYHNHFPEKTSILISKQIPNQAYQFGDIVTVAHCESEVAGYYFDGWKQVGAKDGLLINADTQLDQDLLSGETIILEACWKPKTDTNLTLLLYKSCLDSDKQQLEVMHMNATSGMSIYDVLEQDLENIGQETVEDYFTGFRIEQAENLKDYYVEGDGKSVVSIQLARKQYSVDIVNAKDKPYETSRQFYESYYVLPKTVTNLGEVACYIDQFGNQYEPDSSLMITEDTVLHPRFKVQWCLEDEISCEYIEPDGEVVIEKPDEKGYRFLGWYYDSEFKSFACYGNDTIKINKNTDLYGRWNDTPISYTIKYELGNQKEFYLLSDYASTYHTLQDVVLPTAAEVFLPNNYEFLGWYELGDPKQTIVTKIEKNSYGDKCFCLAVRELSEEEYKNKIQSMSSQSTEQKIEEQIDLSQDLDSKEENGTDTTQTKLPDRESDNNDNQSANPASGSGIKLQEDNTALSNSGLAKKTYKGNAKISKGNTFYKNKIKYRIISVNKVSACSLQKGYHKKTVAIPNLVTYHGKKYKVTMIEKKFCTGNKKITKIKLGKNIVSVAKYAFSSCSGLKSVVIQSKKIPKFYKKSFPNHKKRITFYVKKSKKKALQKEINRISLKKTRIKCN